MKKLYFMFAVLALPLMAFAETGDATPATSVKGSAKPTPTSKTPPACAKTDTHEACLEKSSKHMNEDREDTTRNRADKAVNADAG